GFSRMRLPVCLATKKGPLVCSLLDLLVLRRKTDAALQVEALALRHQLRVLERRSIGPGSDPPTVCFSALSAGSFLGRRAAGFPLGRQLPEARGLEEHHASGSPARAKTNRMQVQRITAAVVDLDQHRGDAPHQRVARTKLPTDDNRVPSGIGERVAGGNIGGLTKKNSRNPCKRANGARRSAGGWSAILPRWSN